MPKFNVWVLQKTEGCPDCRGWIDPEGTDMLNDQCQEGHRGRFTLAQALALLEQYDYGQCKVHDVRFVRCEVDIGLIDNAIGIAMRNGKGAVKVPTAALQDLAQELQLPLSTLEAKWCEGLDPFITLINEEIETYA